MTPNKTITFGIIPAAILTGGFAAMIGATSLMFIIPTLIGFIALAYFIDLYNKNIQLLIEDIELEQKEILEYLKEKNTRYRKELKEYKDKERILKSKLQTKK